MEEAEQEDWLDRQLREATPYIDDDGFTSRVLAKLPPPRPQQTSLRAVILIAITMLGSAIAYSIGGRFVSDAVMRLAGLPMLWLFLFAFASGVLVTAVGLAAAVSKSRELQA
jgi:hypothetical protein